MAKSITDDLLMLLSVLADYHRRFVTLGGVLSMSGDPRFYKYRRLMQRSLANRRKRRQLYDTWYNLIRRGYLQKKIFGNSEGYVLSSKGELKIFHQRFHAKQNRHQLPKGQWLMVFFDVPETKRNMRDRLRIGLDTLGFTPVQKSVWVTRYHVGGEVRKLLELLGAEPYVKPLLVRELAG